MWDPYAETEESYLPNGLRVISAHWPRSNWQAFSFLVFAGTLQEPDHALGVAHLVEHLVSDNSVISKKQFDAFIDDCGGKASFGQTDYAFTTYDCFLPSEGSVIAQALDFFGHMLLLSKLDREFEANRQVVIGEYSTVFKFQKSYDMTLKVLQQVLPDIRARKSVSGLGSVQSLSAITPEDARKFYAQYYVPKNMCILAVGNQKHDEVLRELSESVFMTAKPGECTVLPAPVDILPQPTVNVYEIPYSDFVKYPIELVTYSSVNAIPTDSEEFIMNLIHEIMTEKIFVETRVKRAWQYFPSITWIEYFAARLFKIDIPDMHLDAKDKVIPLVNQVIEECAHDREYFERKKASFCKRLPIVDINGKLFRTLSCADLGMRRKIVSLQETIDGYQAITWEQFVDKFKWFAPERRVIQLFVP